MLLMKSLRNWQNVSGCLFVNVISMLMCLPVASSTSLFNDPVHDIQELTYMIKKDIANLNKKLEGVKALANKKNQQSQQNSDNLLGNLSLKLQDTTKQFRKVLATRSEVFRTLLYWLCDTNVY